MSSALSQTEAVEHAGEHAIEHAIEHASDVREDGIIAPELVEQYRRDGFVRVRGVFSREEALAFREVALKASERMKSPDYNSKIFTQNVNPWRDDANLRRLSLSPRMGAIAQQLAGVDLRLWHDQILIKVPHNNAPTEFHQDQPYWPHANSTQPISAWIALGDVPVERGCMTFLPGSHGRTDLQMQNLGDKTSLFGLAPDLVYSQRVTVPLRAGDLTFHHGRCAHMANANDTDEARVAVTVIYMDDGATFNGAGHVVTDPLNLQTGGSLDGEMFPRVRDFAQTLES